MLRALMWSILVYLTILATVYVFQRSLIYHPTHTKPTLAEWDAKTMKEIYLKTSDGLSLLSWYKPSEQGLPTLLYFQGNEGSFAERVALVRPYMNKGFGVLLLSYHGYDGNPGKPTEQGLYQEARAAYAFLLSQKISSQCIILFGESLGSGPAVQLASEKPVGGVLLLAPYTSLIALGYHHFPYLPVKLLLIDQFNSIKKIASIKAPILVMLAQYDLVVPMKFGKQLFETAQQPKKLIIYPNAGHNDLHFIVQQDVLNFIKQENVCLNIRSSL